MSIRIEFTSREGLKSTTVMDATMDEAIDWVTEGIAEHETLTVSGSPTSFTLPTQHIVGVLYTEVSV